VRVCVYVSLCVCIEVKFCGTVPERIIHGWNRFSYVCVCVCVRACGRVRVVEWLLVGL